MFPESMAIPPGESLEFRVQVKNTGTAPAYWFICNHDQLRWGDSADTRTACSQGKGRRQGNTRALPGSNRERWQR